MPLYNLLWKLIFIILTSEEISTIYLVDLHEKAMHWHDFDDDSHDFNPVSHKFDGYSHDFTSFYSTLNTKQKNRQYQILSVSTLTYSEYYVYFLLKPFY